MRRHDGALLGRGAGRRSTTPPPTTKSSSPVPRDVYDNATPSGNSVATEVLLRLALLLDREDYRARAEAILEGAGGGMEKIPGAFGRLLAALDF